MRDSTTIAICYAALSLVIGGVTVTYEIWHKPLMLDRADGRGKFASPKMQWEELIFFGLFVIVLWPYLAIAIVLDREDEKS